MNSARTKKFGKLLIVLFALASVMMTVAFAEGDGEAVSQFRSPHAPDHFLQNLVEPHQVAFGILLEFTDMNHKSYLILSLK